MVAHRDEVNARREQSVGIRGRQAVDLRGVFSVGYNEIHAQSAPHTPEVLGEIVNGTSTHDVTDAKDLHLFLFRFYARAGE